MKQPGRQVSITSIGTAPDAYKRVDIFKLIENEWREGDDIILLPEVVLGNSVHRLDGSAIKKVRGIAKDREVYIVFPVLRYGEGDKCYNTSVIIDRMGVIVGLYDKIYPYWSEFDLDPKVCPGNTATVVETDFGKIGAAICFDANFPIVFKTLSDKGAEIVLWSSAYSGGLSLAAHAINFNYYIVTSTLTPDCMIFDKAGRRSYCQKTDGDINVSRVVVDLDLRIFHSDFNIEKRDRLLKEHSSEVAIDRNYPDEHWFTLKASKPGVCVQKLAEEYEMEELTPYKRRSADQIDIMRAGQS